MTSNTFMGFFEKVSRIGSFFPLVWFVGVFAFYVRAKIYLGYWPRAYIPDPKSLPFEFHHFIFMASVFPLFGSIFICPIFWLMRFKTGELNFVKEIMPFFLGWVLIGGVVMIPGVDFITWFID